LRRRNDPTKAAQNCQILGASPTRLAQILKAWHVDGQLEQMMASQQNSKPAAGGAPQQQQGSQPAAPQQQGGAPIFKDWASI
jgi:hypothetical protein